MDIGTRIRNLREKAGLTQLDLAKSLKISNSTLSMYEKGKIVPSDDIKIAIADFFDVSIDFLLGRTNQKEKLILVNEDELDPEELEFLDLIEKLTPDQQQFLLSWVKTTLGLKP